MILYLACQGDYMNNQSMNDISFNYFLNTTSYVKAVLNILPDEEVSVQKKALIMELFNYILSTLDKSEIIEIVRISRIFNEQLVLESSKDALIQAKYIYKNFLEKMLFDSFNREIYFDIMNRCIKVYIGYYKELNNDFHELNDTAINNIHIK